MRSVLAIEKKTVIAVSDSGAEERNTPWADFRRPYNAGSGIKKLQELYAVVEFFKERRARLYGFRWKDGLDFRSRGPADPVGVTDQAIGVGNGSATQFQLTKIYGGSFAPYVRTIRKPVAGTVRMAIAGAEQTEGSAWSVDTTTGLVTFTSPPGSGLQITAGFEFDVPVRFDVDRLEIDLQDFEAGRAPNIPILELPDSEVAG